MPQEELQPHKLSQDEQIASSISSESEEGERRRVSILEQWSSLPANKQAALLVEMVQRRGMGSRMESILQRVSPTEVKEGVNEEEPIPTNWIHRDDLLWCCPDRAEQIKNLDRSEIARIAEKIGDALQETYWTVVGIVLANYLGSDDAPADKEEET